MYDACTLINSLGAPFTGSHVATPSLHDGTAPVSFGLFGAMLLERLSQPVTCQFTRPPAMLSRFMPKSQA